jgi:polyhydroxybutyrate depolymerase
MIRLLAFISLATVALVSACDRDKDPRQDAGPFAIDPANAFVSMPSEGCEGARVQPGISEQTIEADGLQRSYRLFIPSTYDQSLPEPLVLNFHGFGSNAASQEAYSGLGDLAEREGFLLVSPDGAGSPPQWHTFGRLLPGYVNDLSFVDYLLDHITATLCVDESRIYAAGLSNGGGMAQTLGCRMKDRIAAVGVVAAAPFIETGCDDPGLMPVIAFHGTADEVVAFNGEGSRFGLTFQPVRTTMQKWAVRNGCDASPVSERVADDVVREYYTGCDDGSAVELYVIEGGGHTWPGALDRPGLGRITRSISASELMWRFFEQHTR